MPGVLVAWQALCLVALAAEVPSPEAAEFFERHVRPLLVEKCQGCHGDKKAEGELRLVSREAILAGGDSGPAGIPGKPSESLLIKAVEYLGEPKMPPSGKLSDGEIEILRQWVASGLAWPDSPAVAKDANVKSRISDKQRGWWSFQPVEAVTVPLLGDAPGTHPIDRFIDARLAAEGITPFPPADKRTLLRRATFDLIGLPPTPEELESFLNDTSPDAFARVVERLLASPQYGPRWARHWLDLVRYADYFEPQPGSHGSAKKFELFEAWRYRDWVCSAMNRDLPYNEFIVHQIAGDLLTSGEAGNPSALAAGESPVSHAAGGDAPYADGLVATTVLAIGAWDNGDADKDKVVSDIVDDQINVISQTFLGLTLACARCHDHKFDPVTTEDYYALAGMFYSSHVLEHVGTKGDHTVLLRAPLVPAEYVARRKEQLERLAGLQAELDKLQPEQPAAATGEGAPASAPSAAVPAETQTAIARLTAERQALEKELLPEPSKAMGIQDGGTPGGLFVGIQDVPVHKRGSYTKLGQVVARRLPEFFAGVNQPPITHGSGRQELAQWIASAENPLTARVMVNRAWQWHFGRGLVSTPSNFGLLGEVPTHPELLDWLARQFVQSGWSVKALHRLMMSSAAYQRASRPPSSGGVESLLVHDPDNRLWARFSPRRLEAECIRDSMLAAGGGLDLTQGGPAASEANCQRRSLYVETTRWRRAYYSSLFDAADPEQPIAERNVTTVAPQALYFLNHPFVQAQSQRLAGRLLAEAADDEHRLRRAYALLFARPPTADEEKIAADFLSRHASGGPQQAWADYLQVLFSSNEFCYVD